MVDHREALLCTPPTRDRLVLARRLVLAADLVLFALFCGWTIAGGPPHPAVLAFLLALPLLAALAVAASGGLCGWAQKGERAGGQVILWVMLAAGGLLQFGRRRVLLAEGTPLLLAGCLLGAAYAVAFVLANPGHREAAARLFVLLPSAALLGLLAPAAINSGFDASPARPVPAEVLRKEISRGKATTYRLALAVPGLPSGASFQVSRPTFEAVTGRATVLEHAGFLGVPWGEVRGDAGVAVR
jgi:hypothetical protein